MTFTKRQIIVSLLLLLQPSAVAGYRMNRQFADTVAGASCDVLRRRGGGGPHSRQDKAEWERRWHSLMTYCRGNWSGSIGWYDVDEGHILKPRPENFQRNMRLSFHPSPERPETVAKWVVYHATARGLRQEVVLVKYPNKQEDDLPSDSSSLSDSSQQFYAFNEGILGRTGRDFTGLPVIEHGFWDEDEGMRRSVVIVYNQTSLSKICFLQQQKQVDDCDFDVSTENPSHLSILPKEHETSLKEMQSWIVASEGAEVLSVSRGYERSDPSQVLTRLNPSEKDEETLRTVLPNGIILACPWSIRDKPRFTIMMGYRRKCGQVQVVEFTYQDAVLQTVRATWIEIA